MPHALFFPHPITLRLPSLIEEVMLGNIQLPSSLRPPARNAWTPIQRLELFDSIYKGLPIGTLTAWRTNHRLDVRSDLGGAPIPRGRGTDYQYIIDGQERLSALYAALAPSLVWANPGAYKPIYLDMLNLEAPGWSIYFDTEARTFQLTPEGTPPPEWFPMSALFDPHKLQLFQDALNTHGLPRRLGNRAEALANSLKDYSVSMTVIATNDLSVMANYIQRAHRPTAPRTEVHLLLAQFNFIPNADKGIHLSDLISGLRDDLRANNWQYVSDAFILSALRYFCDMDVDGVSQEELFIRLKESPQTAFDHAREAIQSAADFLRRRCGVLGPRALPYEVAALALACLIPSKEALENLSESVAQNVTRWFWIGIYTGWFAQLPLPAFESAAELLAEVLSGTASWRAQMPSTPEIIRCSVHCKAREAVHGLLLARLEPLDAEGHPLAGAALLARDGAAARCPWLSWQDSRDIVHVDRLYINVVNQLLLPPTPQGVALAHRLREEPWSLPEAVLASHAIPQEAVEALQRKDYQSALKARAAKLRALERAFIEPLGLSLDD